MARYKIVALVLLLSVSFCQAQTPRERYNAFRKKAQQQYDSFRKKANQQYADFLKQAWEKFNAIEPISIPLDNPQPPVLCPNEDIQKHREDERKSFEDIVTVENPKPQPKPIEHVPNFDSTPRTTPQNHLAETQPRKEPFEPTKPIRDSLTLMFYGTPMKYSMDSKIQFSLPENSNASVAEAWQQLSDGRCDIILSECLNLRHWYRLNDWAYIQMLDMISTALVGTSGNQATLLMAWLYCQSGYKMRLARESNSLYMLFASENTIYELGYYSICGVNYYPYKGDNLEDIYVCDISFPNEQTMTLEMTDEPLLANRPSNQRILQSERYPSLMASTSVNMNLIDFYNDYPTGTIKNYTETRWAIYANTPLGDEARKMLYPQLQKLLDGKSKLQATEELLNFVQTAFVYEYDDKVWGGDRAFFAEETLYYPYSDCEDRSILFSRLVRDLLGLEVVLIYYPNHLATAVRFEGQQPTGDYLDLPDGKYFIADPTYIGATVGMSMPSMRDKKVTIIKLKYDNH